jgi:hypothetical protein
MLSFISGVAKACERIVFFFVGGSLSAVRLGHQTLDVEKSWKCWAQDGSPSVYIPGSMQSRTGRDSHLGKVNI